MLRVTRRFALLQTGTANASSLCTLKQHCASVQNAACLQIASELFPIAVSVKFRIRQESGERVSSAVEPKTRLKWRMILGKICSSL